MRIGTREVLSARVGSRAVLSARIGSRNLLDFHVEIPAETLAVFDARDIAGSNGGSITSWSSADAAFAFTGANIGTLAIDAAYPGGRGLVLDGVDDDGVTADLTGGSLGDFTLAYVFSQQQTPSSSRCPVSFYSGNDSSTFTKVSAGYTIGVANGIARLNSATSYNSDVVRTGYDTTSPTGSFHTLILRRSNTSWHVWIDGVPALSTTGSNTALNGKKLRIGNNSGLWKGALLWIGAWNRALTGDRDTGEVAQLLDYFGQEYNMYRTLGAVVFAGDSITYGVGATTPASGWANLLPVRAKSLRKQFAYKNAGIGGKKVAEFLSDQNGGSDITTNYLKEGWFAGKNYLLFFAGTNDIYTDGTSAATIAANTQTLLTEYRAEGWDVSLLTILPRNFSGEPPSGASSAQRDALRVAQLAASYVDRVIDVGALSVLQKQSDAMPTEYFADGAHPNDAGHAAIADYVQPTLFDLLGIS